MLIVIVIVLSTLPIVSLPPAFAAKQFIFRTSEQVYVPGDTLVVYGAANPNEILIIRIYDPSGLAIRIDNVQVDEDGFFREGVFEWPQPSRNLAFGSYAVEAVSSLAGKETKQRVEVTFAEGTQEGVTPQFPKTHILGVKLDAPTQVKVGSQFRIFIQVTFDGALVDAIDEKAVAEILGSSHIHTENSTIVLNDKFKELHPGLYYADVTLDKVTTYVIHAVAFNRGFISHDSQVVTATASSIGTIQETVNQLDKELNTTNKELERLREGLGETRSALNETKSAITDSVEKAQSSIGGEIKNIQEASGQINAIILPVLALISIIIALQISLFARIRSSYR